MSGEFRKGSYCPSSMPEQMLPGRGRFVRRGERPRLVQVADFRPAQVCRRRRPCRTHGLGDTNQETTNAP
jgi:S-DNA-T family DNA segregation ATPase FtsK/SpoIIIE